MTNYRVAADHDQQPEHPGHPVDVHPAGPVDHTGCGQRGLSKQPMRRSPWCLMVLRTAAAVANGLIGRAG